MGLRAEFRKHFVLALVVGASFGLNACSSVGPNGEPEEDDEYAPLPVPTPSSAQSVPNGIPVVAASPRPVPIDETGLITLSSNFHEQVQGLFWSTKVATIRVEATGGTPRLYARLTGRLEKPGWALKWENQVIFPPTALPKKDFSFEIPLADEQTSVEIDAFDVQGNLETEKLWIEYPNWRTLKKSVEDGTFRIPEVAMSAEDKAKRESEVKSFHEAKLREWDLAKAKSVEDMKRFYFTALLGYTTDTYTDASFLSGAYTQSSLTPEVSVQYVLAPPGLVVGANAYITALPLTTDGGPGLAATYWGADVDFGYVFNTGALSFSLLAGVYYKTMIVPAGLFGATDLGYQNMWGPMLYPVVGINLTGSDILSAHARFSPTIDQLYGFNLTNNEISAGIGWTHRFSNGMSVPIMADLTLVNLPNSPDGVQTAGISNMTYQISLGFGL